MGRGIGKESRLLRMATHRNQSVDDGGAPRAFRQSTFPQSFAQRRIWYVEQAVPGTSMYNLPACVRIRGQLSTTLLQDSLGAIVRRHEAWRSTFGLDEGAPAQTVHEDVPPVFTVEQQHGGEEVARRRLQELCALPFDLERGPLVRMHLLALAHEDWFVLLNVHHIVFDGWSAAVFMKELVGNYMGMAQGRQPGPAPLAFQYRDFVQWQQRQMGAEFIGAGKQWAETLWTDYAYIPPDKPSARNPSSHGQFLMLDLSHEGTLALNRLARTLGMTPFLILATAFKVVLAHLTGNPRASLGIPVAARSRTEFEGLLGLFASTVVLQSDLSGNPTLAEALERERCAWIAAQVHQHVPFENLVEHLGAARTQERDPFFQVMLAFQNAPMPKIDLGQATIEFVSAGAPSIKFDMVLEAYETAEGLKGWLGYRSELFDEATPRRIMAMLHRVLDRAPTRLSSRIFELVAPS